MSNRKPICHGDEECVYPLMAVKFNWDCHGCQHDHGTQQHEHMDRVQHMGRRRSDREVAA